MNRRTARTVAITMVFALVLALGGAAAVGSLGSSKSTSVGNIATGPVDPQQAAVASGGSVCDNLAALASGAETTNFERVLARWVAIRAAAPSDIQPSVDIVINQLQQLRPLLTGEPGALNKVIQGGSPVDAAEADAKIETYARNACGIQLKLQGSSSPPGSSGPPGSAAVVGPQQNLPNSDSVIVNAAKTYLTQRFASAPWLAALTSASDWTIAPDRWSIRTKVAVSKTEAISACGAINAYLDSQSMARSLTILDHSGVLLSGRAPGAPCA